MQHRDRRQTVGMGLRVREVGVSDLVVDRFGHQAGNLHIVGVVAGRVPTVLTINVPLNTMLADLDETLRDLLKEELERHGFEGVDVEFDAPARDWSGQLSKPTVEPVPLRPARSREPARQRVDADPELEQRPPGGDAPADGQWSAPTP